MNILNKKRITKTTIITLLTLFTLVQKTYFVFANTSTSYIPNTSTSYIPNTSTSYIPNTSTSYIPNTSTSYTPNTSTSFTSNRSTSYIPNISNSYIPNTSTYYIPNISNSYISNTSTSYVPNTSTSFTSNRSTSYIPNTSISYIPSSTTVAPSIQPHQYQDLAYDIYADYPIYYGSGYGGVFYGYSSGYFSGNNYNIPSTPVAPSLYYPPGSYTPSRRETTTREIAWQPVDLAIYSTPVAPSLVYAPGTYTPSRRETTTTYRDPIYVPERENIREPQIRETNRLPDGDLVSDRSIYLNQIPYTGTEDILKFVGFGGLILVWSAFVGYYFMNKRNKVQVSKRIEAFKKANKEKFA
jgi:hypothetical protein